jgi:ketosteroid isomerase-like protein/surfactin synthase thioesterase subunit
LGDFKSIVNFYATWFSISVFAVEYPGYGPAEGQPSEASVNDNLNTAFQFLLQLGYPMENIILMGYSIGTGPTIQLAAELCEAGTPPGAVITIAAFLSICDIVRDLRGSIVVSLLADAIANRWNSAEKVKEITCPILFIHGLLDDVIPSEHSEKLYEACASEQKGLRLCPQANHTHFEEPVDTIEPIAIFLNEMLSPQEDAIIIQVPQYKFQCPQSVLEKEAATRGSKAPTTYSDVSSVYVRPDGTTGPKEANCMVDLLGWLTSGVNQMATGITQAADAVAEGLGMSTVTVAQGKKESKFDTSAIDEELKQLEESKVLERRDSAKEGGGNSTANDASANGLPRGPSALMSGSLRSPNGASQDTSSMSGATSSPAGILSDASPALSSELQLLADEAKALISKYYDALNQQDIYGAVALLDNEVLVRFPEGNRNWSGASTAAQKFKFMFKKLPGFTGHLTFLDVSHQNNTIAVRAQCEFVCEVSDYRSTRDMVYVVRDGKILLIEHRL